MNDNNNALPPISFVEATKKGFSNLFNFKGRARRSEYWWYVLTVALIFIVSFSTLCCCYGIMGIYQVADYVIVFTLLLFVAFDLRICRHCLSQPSLQLWYLYYHFSDRRPFAH
jgi:hypothetical protein